MMFRLEYGWAEKINASPPGSKSYAQRALLVASLASGRSQVNVNEPSDDVKAMVRALRAFGISVRGGSVNGGKPLTPATPVLCGESGATIRFMTTYAAIADGGYSFLYGRRRLNERPIGPLLEAINQLGGWAVSALGNNRPPVIVKGGGLRGGAVIVNASESSQYVSALLMISPLFEQGASIKVTNAVSRPYIDMTIRVMEHFGVHVDEENGIYKVKKATYMPGTFNVPADASSASFFILLGIMSGREVLINGLNVDPPQPDLRAMLDVVSRIGWTYEFTSEGLRVYPNKPVREPLELNLMDSPDLLPPVSILGLQVPVKVTGVKHARGKESDRVHAMASELRKLGAETVEFEDGLSVTPPKRPIRGASLNGWDDHRVVMALAVADAALELGSVIDGYENVSKSYPNFFNELSKNGYRAVLL